MNRAMLNPEEVTRIIVSSTMTMPSEDALNDLVIEKCCHTPEKLGCHFYIPRDGEMLTPVDSIERGNWFHRYGQCSIFIVIEGGLDNDAQIANNYMAGQLQTLKAVVSNMQRLYPNAIPTMHHELFLGVNPVLNEEDYSNA